MCSCSREPRMATMSIPAAQSFEIHDDVEEDSPQNTQDTEMEDQTSDEETNNTHSRQDRHNHQQRNRHHVHQDINPEQEEEEEEDEGSETSEDEGPIDGNVQHDMDKLQEAFPNFKKNYKLIKRIGEGTFSTVYKAEDIGYESHDNSWDLLNNITHPPKPSSRRHPQPPKRRYVAIKKIYVTSSPHRILNELELLHELRSCPTVCPLITAFRSTDQVVAILPYFPHDDFRSYFRDMTLPDMRIYFRSLFAALAYTHDAHIIHRDIKPTNFLYNRHHRRGVLVDFGLAEREYVDYKPCLCLDNSDARRHKLTNSVGVRRGAQVGYPKNDTRPSRRANRAGTRGFRAPEVLFKCTAQSCELDVWSAGVILLTIMSRRFPFFNSADDVEAMIELTTLFGSKRMRQAGLLHGVMVETDIPTIGNQGFTLERIILWSTCRVDERKPLSDDEKLAVKFLGRCMDLDPNERMSAEEALQHEFLKEPEEDPYEGEEEEEEEEGADELDMIPV